MSEALIIAILNSVGRVGLEATISLIKNFSERKNLSDAIAALEADSKTWKEFKAEA